MSAIRHTAFHARTAEHNRAQAWSVRAGCVVPSHFGDPAYEALAARTSVALFDFSFMERLHIHGHGTAEMLTRAFAFDVAALPTGMVRNVVWCADGGGVRGYGLLIRLGETNFALQAFDADFAWFAPAAERFGVTVRGATGERGVLMMLGPYAFGVVAAAGLEDAARMAPLRRAIFGWQGINVTVGRASAFPGFEFQCAQDDAVKVFDRLWRAGKLFGMTLAGQEAFETVLLESGLPLPHIDFAPARDGLATEPSPASLIKGWPGENSGEIIIGLELDSETPAPFAPVTRGGAVIGQTLRSAYSPALRRAIALAQMPVAHATPDTDVAVHVMQPSGPSYIGARVTALPFLT